MSNVSKKHKEETDARNQQVAAQTEVANQNTSGWAATKGWGAPVQKPSKP